MLLVWLRSAVENLVSVVGTAGSVVLQNILFESDAPSLGLRLSRLYIEKLLAVKGVNIKEKHSSAPTLRPSES